MGSSFIGECSDGVTRSACGPLLFFLSIVVDEKVPEIKAKKKKRPIWITLEWLMIEQLSAILNQNQKKRAERSNIEPTCKLQDKPVIFVEASGFVASLQSLSKTGVKATSLNSLSAI